MISKTSKNSNVRNESIEKDGPIYWKTIHMTALYTIEEGAIKYFTLMLTVMISTINCKICREFGLKYIADNPPYTFYKKMKYNNTDLVKCIFVWSVNFHNAVNLKLHKSVINWRNAYSMYKTGISVNNPNLCNIYIPITQQYLPTTMKPQSLIYRLKQYILTLLPSTSNNTDKKSFISDRKDTKCTNCPDNNDVDAETSSSSESQIIDSEDSNVLYEGFLS